MHGDSNSLRFRIRSSGFGVSRLEFRIPGHNLRWISLHGRKYWISRELKLYKRNSDDQSNKVIFKLSVISSSPFVFPKFSVYSMERERKNRTGKFVSISDNKQENC